MIWCIEDDSGIRNMMIYTLRAAGFEADGFPDGAAFFEALTERSPELILLDIMLPGEDGISILGKLRQKAETASIPVIMATAKGTEYDKVLGLDLGADDYLVKPFGMMEMVSRVKAVLRRVTPREVECLLCLGRLELDPKRHTVKVDGERVELTRKEYDMLRLFMESPERVFSREQLLSSVWGIDFAGETRTVDVHIGTLRDKLGACGNCIETVRGVGYRMVKSL
jgi:two-component system alkaline phosphatase synthesis response regulator PhoP